MNSCNNRVAVFNIICSQSRSKQNRACDFLLFKYFLNNLLLTVLMQKSTFKTRWIIAIKNEWLFDIKNEGKLLFRILSEMCVQSLKLIVQAVFIMELDKCTLSKNLSLNKLLQLWKPGHQIAFKHFLIKLPSVKFLFKSIHASRQTNHSFALTEK